MDKFDLMMNGVTTFCGSLGQKRVLEVGSDSEGELLRRLDAAFELKAAVGVNPVTREPRREGRISLVGGDARDLAYPDGHFDTVLSVAAFEHIHDFKKCLEELYRVMVPGGLLYSVFGPIWSGCWGHHLWIGHNGETYNYHNTPLPPYCHLLMPEEDLREYCAKKFDDHDLIEKILSFVYHSQDQNRLFFSDYERVFRDSSFGTLFVTGTNSLPLPSEYAPENYDTLFSNLKTKYPDKSGFGYNSIMVLLKKE